MKRLPDKKRRSIVLATRFSPEEIAIIEAAAALGEDDAATTFVRVAALKVATSRLKKAGKAPVTG